MTERDENHREIISLREYFERLLVEHDKAHRDIDKHRLELRDLLQTTVDEISHATETYKASQNEWRGAMNDRERTFATKVEHTGILEKFDLQSRAGADAIAAIGHEVNRRLSTIENTLASRGDLPGMMRDSERRITTMETNQANAVGRQAGTTIAIAFIISLVPIALGVAALIASFR